jgi:hypothetical protein
MFETFMLFFKLVFIVSLYSILRSLLMANYWLCVEDLGRSIFWLQIHWKGLGS